MGRIHLFEFEDLTWFPGSLRNYGTDFLQFLANRTRMYKPVVPLLVAALLKTRSDHMIDLASGGGGGLIWINDEIKKTLPGLKVVLTDYFPNVDAFEYTKKQSDNFSYVHTSVDARNVPEKLKGFRTQFLSFHHFTPADAKQILQNALDSNNGIAIFEAQERSVPGVLAMLFSPLTLFLATPFIRPFRAGRIFFTYIVPVVPLFVLWDGVVSALRTYSVKEMTSLVDSLKNKDAFDWDIGRKRSGPSAVLYLIGTPKEKSSTGQADRLI